MTSKRWISGIAWVGLVLIVLCPVVLGLGVGALVRNVRPSERLSIDGDVTTALEVLGAMVLVFVALCVSAIRRGRWLDRRLVVGVVVLSIALAVATLTPPLFLAAGVVSASQVFCALRQRS